MLEAYPWCWSCVAWQCGFQNGCWVVRVTRDAESQGARMSSWEWKEFCPKLTSRVGFLSVWFSLFHNHLVTPFFKKQSDLMAKLVKASDQEMSSQCAGTLGCFLSVPCPFPEKGENAALSREQFHILGLSCSWLPFLVGTLQTKALLHSSIPLSWSAACCFLPVTELMMLSRGVSAALRAYDHVQEYRWQNCTRGQPWHSPCVETYLQ